MKNVWILPTQVEPTIYMRERENGVDALSYRCRKEYLFDDQGNYTRNEWVWRNLLQLLCMNTR